MPHVVDPHGARLARVRLRVDAGCLQPFLEDWIGQAKVGADAPVERVVAGRHVVVAPRELPCIGREDAGRKSRIMRPLQEGQSELVIVRHVQLVEPHAFRPVGGSDVLDGGGACGGEAVGEVEFPGYFCDGELAEGMVDLVYADGGEADGRGDFVAEYGGGRVACVRVDELAGDYAVAEEGLPVC